MHYTLSCFIVVVAMLDLTAHVACAHPAFSGAAAELEQHWGDVFAFGGVGFARPVDVAIGDEEGISTSRTTVHELGRTRVAHALGAPSGAEAPQQGLPLDAIAALVGDESCSRRPGDRDHAPCPIKYASYRCTGPANMEPRSCPTDCNASCPAGFYCPIIPQLSLNFTPTFVCPNGAVCLEQTSCVWSCPKGFFCRGGQPPVRCPSNNYCRSGSSEPTPCSFIDFCGSGEGLSDPNTAIFGGLVILGAVLASLGIVFLFNYVVEARQLRKQHDVMAKQGTYDIANTLGSPLASPEQRGRGSSSSISSKMGLESATTMPPPSAFDDDGDAVAMQSIACLGPSASRARFTTAVESDNNGNEEREEGLVKQSTMEQFSDSGLQIDFVCDDVRLALKGPGRIRRFVNRVLGVEQVPQVILASISCIIRPGTVTAIMGPSGGGKTSLMNVLAGKAWDYGEVTGDCRVSSRPLSPALVAQLQHFSGFVPQEDVMPRQCTVNENLGFQAKGRLPPESVGDDIRLRVAAATAALGLGRISASRIGDENVRGISGGQRKRVNVGMEVVAQPSVLFGDEVTSGLDATTSLTLCDFLHDLASLCGTTIITVVHQPRYEIFEKFDNLVLLATGGHVVYSGPVSGVRSYFAEHGYEVPANCNPADFYMDVISADSKVESSKPGVTVQTLIDESKRRFSEEVAQYRPREFLDDQVVARQRTGTLTQLLMYIQRSATLLYVRQPMRMLLEGLICCGGAMMLAFCLPSTSFSQVTMQYSLGGLLFSLFLHFSALPTIGPEYAIIQREVSAGFKPLAYFIGKDIALLPKVLYLPLLFSLQYTIIAPRARFADFVSCFLSLAYAASGSGLLLSAALPQSTAQMAAVLVCFVSLLMSGQNPTLETIWAVLPARWLGQCVTAFSPLRWLMDALVSSEHIRTSEFWFLCTTPVMHNTGFNPEVSLGVKCLAMLLLGLLWRVASFVVILLKTR